MEILIQYWDLIIGLIAVVLASVFFIVKFIQHPQGKQVKKVKEWLVYVCLMAERELGEKTGQVKLRYVYDLFLTRFKWLSIVITFEMFSSYVDDALVTVRKMIETNPKIDEFIKNGE